MSLLEVDDVVVQFGGVTAVDHASFTAEAGRITGLIGPNGAGKTTLFAVIAGFERPTSGMVMLEGEDITGRKPHELARMGLARTFQIVQPFAGLTVRENIAVGAFLREAKRGAALAVAEGVAARVGLADQLVEGLLGLVALQLLDLLTRRCQLALKRRHALADRVRRRAELSRHRAER